VATEDELKPVWDMLIVLYPDFTRNKTRKTIRLVFEAWCEVFSGADPSLLMYAAKLHVTRCKWFPAISELIDAMAELVQPPHLTGVEAWGEVERQMRHGGHAVAPQFSDPLVEHLVQQMGWRNLCMSETPGLDRKHFIESYDALVRREATLIRVPPEIREAVTRLRNPGRLGLLSPSKVTEAKHD
jgi:hypothetical protein